jgi:2-polyprenyl-3-methyl-5-hydroxy-6-metoxy-1,4-benzoquinol methylase
VEPRGEDLIRCYNANYAFPPGYVITEGMILEHWDLEKRLREELLESTVENRWEVFEKCYSELYGELDWLGRLMHDGTSDSPSILYGNWIDVIGSPPVKIYEVGSGKGELALYLAKCGFECRATEITHERGQKWVSPHPNLSWGVSDGVHLDQFEPANSYDVVISKQVVEHLHPDDLLDHFKGVFSILTCGGRYVLSTPHAAVGPSDISRVFRRDTPMGMHLKEYEYGEIARLLRQAGFEQVYSVLRLPMRARRLLHGRVRARASGLYMAYLCMVEGLIGVVPGRGLRRKVAAASKLILFASDVMVVATRAQTSASPS